MRSGEAGASSDGDKAGLDLRQIVRVPLRQQEGVSALQLELFIAERLASQMVDKRSIRPLGDKTHRLRAHHPIIFLVVSGAEYGVEVSDQVEHFAAHVEAKAVSCWHLCRGLASTQRTAART